MSAYFGKEYGKIFFLQADTGYGVQPLLGVAINMVRLDAAKNGGPFEQRTITPGYWQERGYGYYSLTFSESDMDTLGEFYWILTVPDYSIRLEGSFDVEPMPFMVDSTAPTCIVYGNIVDIAGEAVMIETIVFRPKHLPLVAGASLVASTYVTTTPDAYGNFSVKLLRSAEVIVEIERAGIRSLIVVPDAPTASILDLLPPIPPQ